MSVSELLTPLSVGKTWSQLNVQSVNTKSASFNGGALTDVGSINGNPIPTFGVDLNPANIIYRPGGPLVNDSNIVDTWAKVVSKVNQVNVNQAINIYIDSTMVNPAPIDISLDCKSRVEFYGAILSAGTQSTCQISDGTILTNPRMFTGSLKVQCESLTGPNIELTNGIIMVVQEGAQITNTLTSTVSSIQITDGNANVISSGYGGIIGTQIGGSLINVGVGSTLIFPMFLNASGQMYIANTISSTDGTASAIFVIDATISSNTIVNSGFTGSVTIQSIDKSIGVNYDDSVSPAFGTTNVQGALDYIKGNYPLSNSSNPFTCGDLTCSRVITGNGSFGSPALQLNNSATGFWNVDSNTIGLAMNGIIWAFFGSAGGFSGLFPGNPGMMLGNNPDPWSSIDVNTINSTSSSLGTASCGTLTVVGVGSTPSNPASGSGKFYVNTSDENPYYLNSSGISTNILSLGTNYGLVLTTNTPGIAGLISWSGGTILSQGSNWSTIDNMNWKTTLGGWYRIIGTVNWSNPGVATGKRTSGYNYNGTGYQDVISVCPVSGDLTIGNWSYDYLLNVNDTIGIFMYTSQIGVTNNSAYMSIQYLHS
jgi:hypothetical protein